MRYGWSRSLLFGRAIAGDCLLPLGTSPAALNAYWIASRQRADNWHEALCIYRHRLENGGASQRLSVWIQLRRIIEEVLLSEVLTRVLAAMATHMENDGLDEDAGPIASNVALSHAEARHRCLQIMVDGVGQPVSDAVQLNRMRFQLEEWTDMLLAQIGTQQERCNTVIEPVASRNGRPIYPRLGPVNSKDSSRSYGCLASQVACQTAFLRRCQPKMECFGRTGGYGNAAS